MRFLKNGMRDPFFLGYMAGETGLVDPSLAPELEKKKIAEVIEKPKRKTNKKEARK